jgi:hypothetical protein
MLTELHGAFGTARRAQTPFLTGERHQKRVLAGIAVHPGCAMLKESAVKIFIQGLKHLVSQHSVGRLEPFFPDSGKFVSSVVHNPVEW